MAQEQTALAGEPIEVLINVIGSSGSHEAATIDTTSTRIDGYPSTAPSVTSVATGIYKIVFSGVTPAPAAGDRLVVKINGTVTSTGTAWSEYGIPVKITTNAANNATAVWDYDLNTGFMYPTYTTGYKLYTTHSNALDAADVRTAVGLSSANLDTQLGDIPTVSEFEARTLLAASYFDPANDTVASVTNTANVLNAVETDAASRNASKADVSGLSTFDASTDQVVASNMRGTDGANTVAPANSDISAIKSKTDQFVFSVANQVDANALTGGSGGDATAANQTAISNAIAALNDFNPASDTVQNVTNTANVLNAVTTDAASRNASKADVSALSTFDASSDQVIASNMRGTDGANTIAPDNAGIAANSSAINALNDLSSQDVENAVWDSSYSVHVQSGTFGKLMDLLRKSNRAIDAEVAGTPSASAFDTNLTGYADSVFDHELLVFTSGALVGEARPILSYSATNGRVTFEEALSAVPQASDEFVILPYHTTPTSEIQDGLVTVGTQFTYTNQAGDSHQVTIS